MSETTVSDPTRLPTLCRSTPPTGSTVVGSGSWPSAASTCRRTSTATGPRTGWRRRPGSSPRAATALTVLEDGRTLPDALAADPDHWLGPDHVAATASSPGS